VAQCSESQRSKVVGSIQRDGKHRACTELQKIEKDTLTQGNNNQAKLLQSINIK